MSSSEKKLAIGIDVGGTNIRAAVVDEEGNILKNLRELVGDRRSPEAICNLLGSFIQKIGAQYPKSQIGGVGIGVPGIVSSSEKMVYSSPHFPDWKNFELGSRLAQKILLPLIMDNDAHMIALGEGWLGAGRGVPHFLMVALGTGVGGALVVDSHIFGGTRGFAGEFGHMVVEAEGPVCACGSRGCWETFVSATGLTRMLQEDLILDELPGLDSLFSLLEKDSSQIVLGLASKAHEGNTEALALWDRMGYYLGIGLASLVNVTGIQNIVLGGGISRSADLFLRQTNEELAQRTYQKTAEGVQIKCAQLGDDAGLVGAAHAVFQFLARSR